MLIKCLKCNEDKEVRKSRVVPNYKCRRCNLIERNTIHGLYYHPLKNVYNTMKQRCSNQNHKMYYRYGQRGITVCKEWMDDYVSFYNWSINNGYAQGLSIDRIDNDGNYEPSNCRWITIQENISRNSKLKEVDIQEIINLYIGNKEKVIYIAEKYNIDRTRIYQILKKQNIKTRGSKC